MLFLAQFDNKSGTGTLFFWNGSANPVQLAEGVDPSNVRFSTDRQKALIVANYQSLTGIGDLKLIDMMAGDLSPIDSGVVIDASVFGTDEFVGAAIAGDYLRIPAFSMTPSLSAVAYTKLSGPDSTPQLFRWPASNGTGLLYEDPTRAVPAAGIFPGISASGKVVAYFVFQPSSGPDSVSSQFLHVWSVETGADLYKINLPQVPAICPKVSADDRFIAFLTNVSLSGQTGTHYALGSLRMAPVKVPAGTSANDTVLSIGVNVDWGSVRFAPNFTNQPTTSMTFIADLRDLGGKPTLTQSAGNIYAMKLENGFPEDFTEPIAQDIYLDFVSSLPNSNGLAFEKRGIFGADDAAHPYVWVPGMKQARQLDRDERTGYSYKRGSLKTSAAIPSLGLRPAVRPDEVGYIILPDPKGGAPVTTGILRGVKVRAGGELAVDVDTAQDRQTYSNFFFDPTGRILGFLAMLGDAKNIQVWDLPFPDAQ
jgi:hypothetical protein